MWPNFLLLIRLLSWAGKGIEPYGVDYILQKLGFAHARVTIPKWMQRGCMDPLDKILAVVMEKMIAAVKNDREEPGATSYIWMLKCVMFHMFLTCIKFMNII